MVCNARRVGVYLIGCVVFSNGLHIDSCGSGTGSILLDNVRCNGDESSITECTHNPWGSHNCGHHEDAACRCYYGNGDYYDSSSCDSMYTCNDIA